MGGRARTCTAVVALIDTNVLVYRFDPRSPRKQQIAQDLLRRGIAAGDIRLPHQVILEFISVVTRPTRQGLPLLPIREAFRETEDLLNQIEVLYPKEGLLRTAMRGATRYQLSWYDAHLWAYAEVHDLSYLISEDFQHDRLYGRVRVINPFLEQVA